MTTLKEVFKINETPDAMGNVYAAEEQLLRALLAAKECPGCWYDDDARRGQLSDHDDNCRDFISNNEAKVNEITGAEFDTAALGDSVHYTTKMIVEEFMGEKEGGPSWHNVYADVWEALTSVVKKHAPNAQTDYE